jgi:hypothetical protein
MQNLSYRVKSARFLSVEQAFGAYRVKSAGYSVGSVPFRRFGQKIV